jgi:hypothetical protein
VSAGSLSPTVSIYSIPPEIVQCSVTLLRAI